MRTCIVWREQGACVLKYLLAAVSALAFAGRAQAADQPQYAPVPAWVKPVPIPPAPRGESAAVQILLWTTQSRFTSEGDETFSEVATRIASQEGLAGAGNYIQTWDPETETLTIHQLRILRDGKVIDLLAGGRKLTVVRRETNLESAMLDGRLTATLQAEDLRVGDVVDAAITLKRKDPALAGRSEGGALAMHAGIARRIYIRQLWPASKAMHWKASEDLGRPVVTRVRDEDELLIDLKDSVTPDAPKGAPGRFAYRGYVQTSEFKGWPEISTAASALWVKPLQLSSESPLRAELAKIRAANATPEARAMAALRLVQDKVRYVYVGMNLGGYTPANADLTWSRRFGDCKGKTALLLALLRELGIEAEPAMVNTAGGDGLDQRLPMFESFDHVLVRAKINERTYWLDGTRSGDRRLSDLPVPDYSWALPVRRAGAGLERLTPREPTVPLEERTVRLDLRGGPDKPAPLEAEQLFREDAGAAFNLLARQQTAQDLDKAVRKFWLDRYPWAQPTAVGFTYDDVNRVARLSFKGLANPPWSQSGRERDLWLDDTALGWDASYTRQPGPHRDAPYAVSYPSYARAQVRVLLPNQGANASFLNDEDIDERLAGTTFHRHTEVKEGVADIEASSRGFEREFPGSEAAAAETRLRDLSTHELLLRITAPLSAQTKLPAPDPSLAETPKDAAGYALRAARSAARKDFDKAQADLDQALKMEPGSAKFFYDRGVIRLRMDRPGPALEDFDQAIKLKPDDALALTARGQLRLLRKEDALAETDFTAALKATSSNPTLAARIAGAYQSLGQYERAVKYLGLALQSADGKKRATLLNDRCYARARWGRELDQAAADCNAALGIEAGASAILDSRALVRLRSKQYALALADYDAALAASPNNADSLYGRGVTKLRLGRNSEAKADFTAARQSDPKVAEQFAAFGVKP